MPWSKSDTVRVKRTFAATVNAVLFAAAFSVMAVAPADMALAGAAAFCKGTPAPHTLQVTQPLNLGEVKLQVRFYACSGAYDADLAKVGAAARAYVEKRASEVAKPALVLDIDETSLSNFPEIVANDFGFIPNGACDALPRGPCGFDAWVLSAKAEAISPTLALFNAAKAKGVAVFFITGRHESDQRRKATIDNLHKAGYDGWAGLTLRSAAASNLTIVQYKSGERARIAERGYTIITNMGDQQSDLDGGYAERAYKLPNPFYYLP
jgi:acid phosphatase